MHNTAVHAEGDKTGDPPAEAEAAIQLECQVCGTSEDVIGAGKALSSLTITTIGDDKLDSREILMSKAVGDAAPQSLPDKIFPPSSSLCCCHPPCCCNSTANDAKDAHEQQRISA